MKRKSVILFLVGVIIIIATVGQLHSQSLDRRASPTPLPDWIPTPNDLAMVSESRLLQAVEVAQQAVEKAPEKADTWGQLGNVYLVHGWERQAAPCYRRAAEIQPNEFRWFYYLGLSTYKATPEVAVDAFAQAITLDPKYPPAHINHAYALRRLGRFESAKKHLERAKTLDPKNPFADLELGELALAAKQFEVARKYLTRALTLNPEQSEAHSAMAQVALVLGDAQAAKRHSQAARKPTKHAEMRDPLWWELLKVGVTAKRYAERGTRHMEAGDFENAIANLAVAASSKKKDAEIWFNYGVALLSVNRYKQAQAALEHTLAVINENDLEGGMSPKTPKELAFLEIHSYYNLGFVYNRTEQTSKAIPAYQKAIKLNPDFANAYAGLGLVYGKQRRLGEAITHGKKAIKIAPANVELHRSLATIYWQAKMYNEAAIEYQTILGYKPRDAGAIHQLGLILMGNKMYDEAMTCFKKVLEIQPHDPLAHGALATVLYKLGDHRAAIDEFQAVLRLAPDNRNAQLMLRQLAR